MNNKLIKLERNFMFTDIFNQDRNVPKLEKFISIFFGFEYEKVHGNLKLLPRKLSKDNKKEAWKEVDLLLKLDNEMLKINIEINDQETQNIINRNIIYIAKISSTNYETGDNKLDNIWTSRQINFNIKDTKHTKFISEYVFKERETNEILSEIVQIDVINMAIIDKLCYTDLNEKEKAVYNFCKMLNAESKEDFERASELVMDEELSRDLLDQMTRKSREEEYVYMESAYANEKDYYADVIREHEEAAKNLGKEEGIKQEKINIAKNMLKEGIDEDLITKTTNLTKEELKNIKGK